jgi:hypothetical protein
MTTTQRSALKELGSVCDTFIKYNYPNMTLDVGYRHFLKDLENEREAWTTDDSIAVMNVNRTLKAAFGEGYNSDKAYFTSISTLTTCLEEKSNNRFVDDFIKGNINSGGGLGPNIIGWSIINNKVDPISGLVKIIYQTEVVYRILYFTTIE